MSGPSTSTLEPAAVSPVGELNHRVRPPVRDGAGDSHAHRFSLCFTLPQTNLQPM